MVRHVSGFLCGMLLAFMVSACNRPVETQNFASLPHIDPALQAIDSLTWQQPDSALAVLLDYFARRDALNASPNDASSNASPKNDINDSIPRRNHCLSTTYNRHYAHLLLAELLYKNGYAQTNRTELLKAMAYYDSLAFALNDAPTPRSRHCGLDPQSPNSCDPFFFLAARAHYINGAGYYENDSTVEACQQYLKALDVMERHFEEKDLVGNKARFMTYTYNRLGDLFSAQFMMDAAIYCYRNSVCFSKISPISAYSVSSALYRIGLQFNKKKEPDSTNLYYLDALANIPDTSNLLYRDIVSSLYFFYFQQTRQTGPTLQRLKQLVSATDDFDEKLTRYLTIGDVYFEDRQYDSARHYLQLVFENQDAVVVQLQAADFLRVLCDSLGEKEDLEVYMRFLAMHKPMEYASDVKVSSLSELYKHYMEKVREKQTEKEKLVERRRAAKKTVGLLIPISFFLMFAIGLLIRKRHQRNIQAKDKVLEEAQKRHAEAIEAERKLHLLEKSAISGRLKKSNQELRELREKVKLQEERDPKTDRAGSFTEEPVCKLIMARVKEGKFKSKVDYIYYKDYVLDKEQLRDLRMAVDYHFNQMTTRLKKAYPALTKTDIDYCCLYMLGLTDADVAALMQRAYNTVSERSNRLRKIFGNENLLSVTLWDMVGNKYISNNQDVG